LIAEAALSTSDASDSNMDAAVSQEITDSSAARTTTPLKRPARDGLTA